MTTWRSYALASLCGGICLISTTLTAQDREPLAGCDCPTVRLDDAYCASALVFEGVPLSTDTVFAVGDKLKYPNNTIDHVAILFRVDRALKGVVVENTVVSTSFLRDDCAFRFILGQPYLVFAQKDGDMMVTDRCKPTRSMDMVGRSFADSLEYVRSGHQWVGHMPMDKPCE